MSASRVFVTILEKELPYELILIDIAKGNQKTEDYKKLQPFGKVPVLNDDNDDGFIIFESRAICKYLARKYRSGAELIPEGDDESYGRFEQACSIEQSYFAAAAETIGTELMMKPVAQAEQDLDIVLAVYDKILASQKYLAGNDLTLADLFHLPNGTALMAGRWKEVFKKYPNAEKWFRGLQERESWVKAAGEAGTIPEDMVVMDRSFGHCQRQQGQASLILHTLL